MLGNEELLKALQERLQEFPEGDGKYPALLFAPTEWHGGKNTCYVLNEYGSIVAKQEKQHSFPYPKDGEEYLENLVPDDVITVMHCDGIGRIVIMICRDALPREHLHTVLEYLKATLLIIPSFSTGNYDFEDRMQMCRSYDCCAVWINTCSVHMVDESVGEKLNKIGMILRTGKGKLKNHTFDCLRSNQNCDGLGDKECTECMYVKGRLRRCY